MKKNKKTKLLIFFVVFIAFFGFLASCMCIASSSTFFLLNRESSSKDALTLPAYFPEDIIFYKDSKLVSSFFTKKDNYEQYTLNFNVNVEGDIQRNNVISFFSESLEKMGWKIIYQEDHNTATIEMTKSNSKIIISARNVSNSSVNYSFILQTTN